MSIIEALFLGVMIFLWSRVVTDLIVKRWFTARSPHTQKTRPDD